MWFQAPNLCQVIAGPIRWLPQRLHSTSLSLILNQLLRPATTEGQLDFLRGKRISFDVTDLGISYCVVLEQNGFQAVAGSNDSNVRFRGDVYTYLLLATQREDADTLFFQRLLRIEGDVATGLHLKNYLDAFGQSPLPRLARQALERVTDFYARRCREVQATQFNPARPSQ
jgi:predicted lipid carrier protein YhbT